MDPSASSMLAVVASSPPRKKHRAAPNTSIAAVGVARVALATTAQCVNPPLAHELMASSSAEVLVSIIAAVLAGELIVGISMRDRVSTAMEREALRGGGQDAVPPFGFVRVRIPGDALKTHRVPPSA